MYTNYIHDKITMPLEFNTSIQVCKSYPYLKNNDIIYYDGTSLPNITDDSRISKYKIFIPLEMYIPFVGKEDENSTVQEITKIKNRIPMPNKFVSVPEYLFYLNFEKKLIILQNSVSTTKVLDFLFETFEEKLIAGEFDLCNSFLEFFNVKEFNVSILLGLLTISYPWKKKLFYRDNLYYKIENVISKSFPMDEAKDLLWGLE